MTALTDLGIHKTPSDVMEDDLKQAGWISVTAHRNSPTWLSPADGLIYPTAMAVEMARQGVIEDPFIKEAQRAAKEAEKYNTRPSKDKRF